MNKWQIICPVVAMFLAVIVFGGFFGSIHMRGEHRSFLFVASRTIGQDIIDSTNSTHLVHIGPDLQSRLSELLSARTQVAGVLLGDEPAPFGDGTASSRLVLSNEVGTALMIRLRPAGSGKFDILGFRTVSN